MLRESTFLGPLDLVWYENELQIEIEKALWCSFQWARTVVLDLETREGAAGNSAPGARGGVPGRLTEKNQSPLEIAREGMADAAAGGAAAGSRIGPYRGTSLTIKRHPLQGYLAHKNLPPPLGPP